MLVSNYDLLGSFISASKGTDYVDNIPQLTRENITEVGNAILDYQPSMDAFYSSFLVKIALQMFQGLIANNKFKFLKGMQITDGDIEDAYVDYIKSNNFDGSDEDPYTISKADIKTLYHKRNRQSRYDTTLSDAQLRNAMLGEFGLSRLMSTVINTMYQSAEWDEYTLIKQLIVDNFTHAGKVVSITGDTPLARVSNLLYELKRHSQDLDFVSREFNEMEVANRTPMGEQLLVLHKDYKLNIDMSVLANTYNMSKLELETQIITVDNFNDSDDDIIAVMMDRRGFRIHDTLVQMRTQINNKSLYTNYFLHIWQIISYAYFMNCVYFVEDFSPSGLIIEKSILNISSVDGNDPVEVIDFMGTFANYHFIDIQASDVNISFKVIVGEVEHDYYVDDFQVEVVAPLGLSYHLPITSVTGPQINIVSSIGTVGLFEINTDLIDVDEATFNIIMTITRQ